MHPPFPVTIASRTCLIVADCILIYLTWSQLPTEHKHRVFHRRTSLIDVLLRDGTPDSMIIQSCSNLIDYKARFTSCRYCLARSNIHPVPIHNTRTLLILNVLHLAFTLLAVGIGSLTIITGLTIDIGPLSDV